MIKILHGYVSIAPNFDFKIVIAIFHSKMNLPYIIMALGCLCGELELAPV